MQSLDSSSSGACTVGRPAEKSRSVECKFKQMVTAQQKILSSFLEIDKQLDGEEDGEEKGSADKKRRKKWHSRSSDFLSVSTKTAQEDLDEIFGDSPEGSQTQSDGEFKVNDVVTCTLGKRRFKGTVFRTNSRGVIIKTSDRKKIKLEWDAINGDEIQLVKVKDTSRN